MKNLLNIILCIAFIAFLCSCNANKRWTNRGIRKGWLDTTTKVKTGEVKIDTVETYAIVDTVFEKIFVDIHHPCDEKGNLTPATKKKIVTETKKKLVPQLQTAFMVPLRNINLEGGGQLSLWYDSTKAAIDYKLTLPGQRTICPDPTFKEAWKKVWWTNLVSFFTGAIVFLLFLYLISRIKGNP